MQDCGAAVAKAAERLGSCAESRLPVMLLAMARDRAAAGRVEAFGGVGAGATESVAAEDRLEKPRTRDREGQHWGLLSESLGRANVCWSGGLVEGSGPAASAA